MSRDRVQSAVDQIQFARRFTSSVLVDLSPDEWFWQPAEGVTHIAWQVGHLATSQYGLCLLRQRGPLEADENLIPAEFRANFGKGSEPVSGPQNNLATAAIEAVFDGVYEQVQAELAQQTDQQLDVPAGKPHPLFDTKLGAIEWASGHELVHAGQIALLRRLMGKKPLR